MVSWVSSLPALGARPTGDISTTDVGRIPGHVRHSPARRRRVQRRGHRGHQRLRRSDPPRHLSAHPRVRRTASPPARSPSSSICTPTSLATTSRSSPPAAIWWSASVGPTAPAPRAGPSKRYRVSELDHSLNFPPRRDDLLGTLLARALQMLPADQAEASPRRSGSTTAAASPSRMAPSEGQRSVKAALATVADALTAHGFAAHAESRGKVLTIVNEHCPFGDAARQFPHVVCAVDRGMIRGLMAGLVRRDRPAVRVEPARRRRPLRRPRLTPSSTTSIHARLPRSRVVLAAAPGRARRDAARSCGSTTRIRAGSTPTVGSPGSRSKTAREQVAALVGARPTRDRVHVAAAPRRSTPRSTARARRADGAGRHRDHRGRAFERARRVPPRAGRDRSSSASTGTGRFAAPRSLDAITDDTALVSIQLANHEVGTLQPAARDRAPTTRDPRRAGPRRRVRRDRLRTRSTSRRSAPTS